MQRWLLLAVVGCGAPPQKTAPAPAPSVSGCRAAAAHLMEPHGLSDRQVHEKMVSVIATRCDVDRWSIETRRCYRALRPDDTSRHCDQLLSTTQFRAVAAAMHVAFPSTSPRPDDSGATSACSMPGPIVVMTTARGTSEPELCAPVRKALAAHATMQRSSYEVRVLLTALGANHGSVSCKVSVTVRSPTAMVAWLSGSAKVAELGRAAERDCVDAVVDDLLTKKVMPFLRRRLATAVIAPVLNP